MATKTKTPKELTEQEANYLAAFRKYARSKYYQDHVHDNNKDGLIRADGQAFIKNFLRKVIHNWHWNVQELHNPKESSSLLRVLFSKLNDIYNALDAATSMQYIPRDYIKTNYQGNTREEVMRLHGVESPLAAEANFSYQLDKHVIPVKGGDGDVILNTWRPWGLCNQPCFEEPPQIWFDFLDAMFPPTEEEDRTCQDYVVKWLAYTLKYQSTRPITGILCRSAQGTGKGTLIQSIIAPLLNGRVHTITKFGDLLKETATSLLADNKIMMVDDFPVQRKDIAEDLKSVMAEKGGHVRRLYQNPVMCRFYAPFWFNTNSVRPFRIPEDDRRFFCPDFIDHQVDKETTKREIIIPLLNYFYPPELQISEHEHDVIDEARFNCLFQWFMQQDLSTFDPKMPPMTKAKAVLTGMSESLTSKNFTAFFELLERHNVQCIYADWVTTAFNAVDSINSKDLNFIQQRMSEAGFLYCPKLASSSKTGVDVAGGRVWFKESTLGVLRKGKVSIKHTEAAQNLLDTKGALYNALDESGFEVLVHD